MSLFLNSAVNGAQNGASLLQYPIRIPGSNNPILNSNNPIELFKFKQGPTVTAKRPKKPNFVLIIIIALAGYFILK